jgi:hypothetical protein
VHVFKEIGIEQHLSQAEIVIMKAEQLPRAIFDEIKIDSHRKELVSTVYKE